MSVTSRLAAVPGVTASKVRVSTVTVRIDYGKAAPSQTSLVRLTPVGGVWYTINDSSSKRAFTATNFC